ncbi:GyrI-like domain-containing protein [Vibrio sp. 10N.222.54.F12]|uniref:AraC family transcriptional regulator n=1 Tax=Vibrio TaxID=662 RepID=UPI000C81B1A6|nr:AraC family transcriptional regulator [Vibrio tasmaniensis]PML14074.1 hypothetical protein BCT83_17780 [Vibrio tasmaniensis]
MQNNHVRLEKVVRYLESHLDQPVVIEELLSKFYFSKYHFHHLFRAYYGEGVYAMRKRLLLERTAQSIVYGVENMTEIAFSCGYENQASFNKAIRKQFSCTPSYIRHQKTVPALKRQQLTSFEDIKMNINVVDCKSTEVLYSRGSGKYAKALHKGTYEKLSEAYSYLLLKWLPDSGFELRDQPCFEVYLNRDPRRTKPENLKTEIYIPIK